MYKFLPILLFVIGLAVTTDEIYDNSREFIISIDKYQNIENLNYDIDGIKSIKEILENNAKLKFVPIINNTDIYN